MQLVPQVLRNVEVERSRAAERRRDLLEPVQAIESELGGEGRVLVRPSGTEPVVRVMVEALDPEAAGEAADRLVELVEHVANRNSLGTP